MKGNANVLRVLNEAARAELQAICQYRTHHHLQKGAGYSKISKRLTREHMLDEEKHLHLFMERIIELDGVPDIGFMPQLIIGEEIPSQFEADLGAEYGAIEQYKEAAILCGQIGDVVSQRLFEKILREEEHHAGDFETQLSLIHDTGLENYLARHSHVEAK